jgi:hypothetical protein
MQAQTKQRGRPKGSNSFVKVRMSDLVNTLGPQASIMVSKIWMRENGLTLDEKPITISPVADIPAPEEKIEFAITSFED